MRKQAADRVRRLCRTSVLAVVCMFAALPATAERSDRNKPVNLEADHMTVDDAKHVATFEGNVVLTQGTLVMHSDRMVVQQDAAGFQFGTAYGNPANFRQKRDKRNEYIEGYGARIEYDNKTNRVQLFEHARLKKGGDEVRGEHISYEIATEFYRVVGNSEQKTMTSSNGRVRAVIQPKSNNIPEQSPPLPLKSTPQITPPDDSSTSFAH